MPEVPDEQRTGAASTPDNHVRALVQSASRWMREALDGWANDDAPAMAMLATIALEHLGKAALWARSPALLVTLANGHEPSLRILTQPTPDLANPQLRTIGLSEVLGRLATYVDPWPLTLERKKSLLEVRNGSVHMASVRRAGVVLRDVLSVSVALLDDLQLRRHEFFGDHDTDVQALLDEKRTEVQATVDAKMAAARKLLQTLMASLASEDVYAETIAALQAQAPSAVDIRVWGHVPDIIALDHGCPQCGSMGRLVGRLDVDVEPDYDVEKTGDGYEAYVTGAHPVLTFTPHAFGCNVCRLRLDGSEELGAADLPETTYQPDPSDFDDDFDPDAFAWGALEDDRY